MRVEPKVVILSALAGLCFILLSVSNGWFGTLVWSLVLLAAGFFAAYWAPELEHKHANRAMITIPILFFLLGGVLLFVLVEQTLARRLTALLTTFGFFVALTAIYDKQLPAQLHIRRLIPTMRMALYGGLYALFSAGFGIMIFLKLPVWFFAPVLSALCGLAVWSLLIIADCSKQRLLPSVYVISVLTFELFWVITFLPLAYPVAGFVLSSAVYIAVQAIAQHGAGERLKKRARSRMISASLATAFVLAIARWI